MHTCMSRHKRRLHGQKNTLDWSLTAAHGAPAHAQSQVWLPPFPRIYVVRGLGSLKFVKVTKKSGSDH